MESILSLRDVKVRTFPTLCDGDLTVPIHTPHRKYLWFSWKGTNYQFKVLPFGLSTAPRTFTKTMQPVMEKLREQGLHLVIYLDDILLMADSPGKFDTTLAFDQFSTGFGVYTKYQEMCVGTQPED